MFTGIIEEVGQVRHVLSGGHSGEIAIAAETVTQDTKIGDSIAVNGVCLTVTRLDFGGFAADVMPETLRRSNLGLLRQGDPVDLERAMAANGRFGGHFVSGHIDGTGRISSVRREENAHWVRISAGKNLLRMVVEKGSIAIDGISLTVAKVSEADFEVSLIPHTAGNTILLGKRPGDTVNLETDLMGKYIDKLMRFPESAGNAETPESGVTMDLLNRCGFV